MSIEDDSYYRKRRLQLPSELNSFFPNDVGAEGIILEKWQQFQSQSQAEPFLKTVVKELGSRLSARPRQHSATWFLEGFLDVFLRVNFGGDGYDAGQLRQELNQRIRTSTEWLAAATSEPPASSALTAATPDSASVTSDRLTQLDIGVDEFCFEQKVFRRNFEPQITRERAGYAGVTKPELYAYLLREGYGMTNWSQMGRYLHVSRTTADRNYHSAAAKFATIPDRRQH